MRLLSEYRKVFKQFNAYSMDRVMVRYHDSIVTACRRFGVRSILNYGSGHDTWYQRYGYELGVRYKGWEPALGHRWRFPVQSFDMVLCVDVLEHIHADDLRWVVRELFDTSRKLVFATVSTRAAVLRLPNGENGHVTVRPYEWWQGLFRGQARGRNFVVLDKPDRYSEALGTWTTKWQAMSR